MPKEPPLLPDLSEAPEDLVRLHQGELYSSREPTRPEVLKSLILKQVIVGLWMTSRAFLKKVLALSDCCCDQKSNARFSASSRLA